MPKLHILSGVLEGKIVDLTDERITVGRALDNMIRLEDGTVSHHHAMFLIDGTDYKVRDLNSTNGTRVNALRIVETKLHNGDQVRFGSVELRYESDAKKQSQPLPPSKTGIDLTELAHTSSPPEAFGPTSPFGKKHKRGPSPWVWAMLGLAVLAIAGLALFLVKFISLR